MYRFNTPDDYFVSFMGYDYPIHITEGNHSRFIRPIFEAVCLQLGERGVDIGYSKEEWAISNLPDVVKIDKDEDAIDFFHEKNQDKFDWIFSSHCLEHLREPYKALDTWVDNIRAGGCLFLYLPHPDCKYWLPEFMPTKKHLHSWSPKKMVSIFEKLGLKYIQCSQRDLAYSYAIYGYK